MPTTLELAHRIAEVPQQALRQTKRLMNTHLTRALAGLFDDALATERVSVNSADHKELTRHSSRPPPRSGAAVVKGRCAMISGELDGRVALVTAAAGAGIGKAIATRPAAADGAMVIVTDVHQRRLDAAVAEIGGNAVGYLLDAGDRDQIVQVTDAVAAAHGPISILVNNAALNVLGPIFDYDPADWDRVMAVNLSGPWMLSRQVMRQLREAGLPG